MTQQRDIDHLLDQWFSDGPTRAPDWVIDVVADRIERQPQRPAWRFHLREIHVNTIVRAGAAMAAVVIVAVIGFNLLPGSGVGGSGPTAPPSPTTSAGLTATTVALPVKVTLGVYSGQPDPVWSLTGEEAAGLERLLAMLPDGTDTPPVGGLGYHGFTIERPRSTLIAYQGVVASPGEGPRTVKADPTRSVERYLLEIFRSQITAVEYAEVERALATP